MYHDTVCTYFDKQMGDDGLPSFRDEMFVHHRSSISSITTCSTGSSNDGTTMTAAAAAVSSTRNATVAMTRDEDDDDDARRRRVMAWVHHELDLYFRLALVARQPRPVAATRHKAWTTADDGRLLLCMVHRYHPTKVPDLAHRLAHDTPAQCLALAEQCIENEDGPGAWIDAMYEQSLLPSSNDSAVTAAATNTNTILISTNTSSNHPPHRPATALVDQLAPILLPPPCLSTKEAKKETNEEQSAGPASPPASEDPVWQRPPDDDKENSRQRVRATQQCLLALIQQQHPDIVTLHRAADRLTSIHRAKSHVQPGVEAWELQLREIDELNDTLQQTRDDATAPAAYVRDLLIQQVAATKTTTLKHLTLCRHAQRVHQWASQQQAALARVQQRLRDASHRADSLKFDDFDRLTQSEPEIPLFYRQLTVIKAATDQYRHEEPVACLMDASASSPYVALMDMAHRALRHLDRVGAQWQKVWRQCTLLESKRSFSRHVADASEKARQFVSNTQQLRDLATTLDTLDDDTAISPCSTLLQQWQVLARRVARLRGGNDKDDGNDTDGKDDNDNDNDMDDDHKNESMTAHRLESLYLQVQDQARDCDCPESMVPCAVWLMQAMDAWRALLKHVETQVKGAWTAIDARKQALILLRDCQQVESEAKMVQMLLQDGDNVTLLADNDDAWLMAQATCLDDAIDRLLRKVNAQKSMSLSLFPVSHPFFDHAVQKVQERVLACRAASHHGLQAYQERRQHRLTSATVADATLYAGQQRVKVADALQSLQLLWCTWPVALNDNDDADRGDQRWWEAQIHAATQQQAQFQQEFQRFASDSHEMANDTQKAQTQEALWPWQCMVQQHDDGVQAMVKRLAWERAWAKATTYVHTCTRTLHQVVSDNNDTMDLTHWQHDMATLSMAAHDAWDALMHHPTLRNAENQGHDQAPWFNAPSWTRLQHRQSTLRRSIAALDALWHQTRVETQQNAIVNDFLENSVNLQQSVISPAIDTLHDALCSSSNFENVNDTCSSDMFALLSPPLGSPLLHSPILADKHRFSMLLDGYDPLLGAVGQWLALADGCHRRSTWEHQWHQDSTKYQQWHGQLTAALQQHEQCSDQDHANQADEPIDTIVASVDATNLAMVTSLYDQMQQAYDTHDEMMPASVVSKQSQLIALQSELATLVSQWHQHQLAIQAHQQRCAAYRQDAVALELVLAGLRTDVTVAHQRYGKVEPTQPMSERQQQAHALQSLKTHIHASVEAHVAMYQSLASQASLIHHKRPTATAIADRHARLDAQWTAVHRDATTLALLVARLDQWHHVCDQIDALAADIHELHQKSKNVDHSRIFTEMASWMPFVSTIQTQLDAIDDMLVHLGSNHDVINDASNRDKVTQRYETLRGQFTRWKHEMGVILAKAIDDATSTTETRLVSIANTDLLAYDATTRIMPVVHHHDDWVHAMYATRDALVSLKKTTFIEIDAELLANATDREQWLHDAVLQGAVAIGKAGSDVLDQISHYRHALQMWAETDTTDDVMDVKLWQGKLVALEEGSLRSLMTQLAAARIHFAENSQWQQQWSNAFDDHVQTLKKQATVAWIDLLEQMDAVKLRDHAQKIDTQWRALVAYIDDACDASLAAHPTAQLTAHTDMPAVTVNSSPTAEDDDDGDDAVTSMMGREQHLVHAKHALDELDRRVHRKMDVLAHDVLLLVADDSMGGAWVDQADVHGVMAKWDHVVALQKDHLDHQLLVCQYMDTAAEVFGYVDMVDDILQKYEPPPTCENGIGASARMSPPLPTPSASHHHHLHPLYHHQQQQQQQQLQQTMRMDDQVSIVAFDTQYKIYHALLVSSLDRAKEAATKVQTPTDIALLIAKKTQLEQRFARQMKKWQQQHQRSRKISLPTKISASASSMINTRRRFSSSSSSSTTTNTTASSSTTTSSTRKTTTVISALPHRPNDYIADPHNDLDMAIGRIVNRAPYKVELHMVPGDEGRYWFGNKLVFCRILKSRMVMVRVGGGWTELSRFLRDHALLVSGSNTGTTPSNGTTQDMFLEVRGTNARRRPSVSTSTSSLSSQAGYKDGDRYIAVDQQGNQHEMKMTPHDPVPTRRAW
ncbi:hypothetical protein BC940DRAFT_368026 [Gongronella butleri]|nr:hypothetical protein BC940DRAFT_368026 [Gongronella butleri]